jgi:hypothetical protein
MAAAVLHALPVSDESWSGREVGASQQDMGTVTAITVRRSALTDTAMADLLIQPTLMSIVRGWRVVKGDVSSMQANTRASTGRAQRIDVKGTA